MKILSNNMTGLTDKWKHMTKLRQVQLINRIYTFEKMRGKL